MGQSGAVGSAIVLASIWLAAAPAGAGKHAVARIWLGGDVHLAAGARGLLAAIPHLVDGAAGIVNLEGPIAAAPAPGPGLRLVNPASAPAELAAAGVRVATLANNHAGDAGPTSGPATARALAVRGLAPAGGASGFALMTLGETRIAVTAHDLAAALAPGLATRGVAGGEGPVADGVPSSLAEDLRRARRAADVLVTTFHVSTPPSYLPGTALTRAVDEAIAAGASVVAVHGSHLLGRVERRGATVIAWGLGNLVFACDCTRETEALLLEVEVGRGGAGAARVIPIAAGLGGAPVTAAPDAAGIFDLLAALGSSPLRRAGDRASF